MDTLTIVNITTLLITSGLIITGMILNHIKLPVNQTDGAEKLIPKLSEREEKMVLLLLFALAFVLRIWQFGSVPDGMNQDGAMAAVDAKALADYGTDRFGMFLPAHFTAWSYGQMSVLLSYCMIPFIKILGLTNMAARIPALIFSMLGLAALYYVGKKLTGKTGAFIILALGVCNPWHFIQSRWALDCNLLPHVFLIGLAFLLAGTSGKKAFLYLSMVFFALCMYCYGIAFYTVTLFLPLAALYLLIRRLVKWREVLLCAAVYLLVAWPIILTMFINATGGHTISLFFCTIPYFPYSKRSSDILFFSADKGGQLIRNVHSLLSVYLKGDTLPWNTVKGFGVIYLCLLPFVGYGLAVAVRRLMHAHPNMSPDVVSSGEKNISGMKKAEADKEATEKVTAVTSKTGDGGAGSVAAPERDQAAWFLLLLYFGIANLSGLITANVNVNRINLLMYSLILLAGIGLYRLFCNFRKGAAGAVLLCAVMSVLFFHTYFTEHAEILHKYFFDDFIEAVRFVKEEAPELSYVITPESQNTKSTNVSEILTLFAADVDAHFFQGICTDETGLTYKEKYRYCYAQETAIDPKAPVAYVISARETMLDWSEYVIFQVGRYFVMIPRLYL